MNTDTWRVDPKPVLAPLIPLILGMQDAVTTRPAHSPHWKTAVDTLRRALGASSSTFEIESFGAILRNPKPSNKRDAYLKCAAHLDGAIKGCRVLGHGGASAWQQSAWLEFELQYALAAAYLGELLEDGVVREMRPYNICAIDDEPPILRALTGGRLIGATSPDDGPLGALAIDYLTPNIEGDSTRAGLLRRLSHLMRTKSGGLDALVVDLHYGKGVTFDGFGVIRALRQNGVVLENDPKEGVEQVDAFEGRPLIVVSGFHDEGSVAEAIQNGADGYIVKPINAPATPWATEHLTPRLVLAFFEFARKKAKLVNRWNICQRDLGRLASRTVDHANGIRDSNNKEFKTVPDEKQSFDANVANRLPLPD